MAQKASKPEPSRMQQMRDAALANAAGTVLAAALVAIGGALAAWLGAHGGEHIDVRKWMVAIVVVVLVAMAVALIAMRGRLASARAKPHAALIRRALTLDGSLKHDNPGVAAPWSLATQYNGVRDKALEATGGAGLESLPPADRHAHDPSVAQQSYGTLRGWVGQVLAALGHEPS